LSLASRIWRWTGGAVAALALLLAVAIGGFRLWLEHSATLVPELVARVEHATGLTIRFARIDARLGLHGPELVFRDAQISSRDGAVTLATANAGRVGFDVWRSIATGRMAAARIVLDGAVVHVLVKPSGLELLGAEALASQDTAGTPLRLDTLPVGHLAIEKGLVVVHDLRATQRIWRIERVDLDLERDPESLVLVGRLKLPDPLGQRLDFSATVRGDLAVPAHLSWAARVDGTALNLAGWVALLPAELRIPRAGFGTLGITAAGQGANLERGGARVSLANVVLPPQAAAAPTSLKAISGELTFEHHGAQYAVGGLGLNIETPATTWSRGQFDAGVDVGSRGLDAFWLRSPALKLEALAALVPLLPDYELRAALTALAPQGTLTAIDVTARRASQPGEWSVSGAGRFTGLGFQAWRRVPGISGADGDFAAHAASGRLHVRSSRFGFALPEMLRAPVGADQLHATVDWWWRPDGWRFASDDLGAVTRDGRANGKMRLWLPANGDSSRLVLDLALADGVARSVTKYLPMLSYPTMATGWLDAAFLSGRVTSGRIEYVGEIAQFPFRDRDGLFRITGHVEGLRLHLAPGWPDIENLTTDVEFKNQGFSAVVRSGTFGGAVIEQGTAGMADFRGAELIAAGRASGELARGLEVIKQSPLAAGLGAFFAGIEADGSMVTDIRLDFPFSRFADYRVDARVSMSRAWASVPGLGRVFDALNGSFELHNLDLEVPLVTGTMYGEPVRVTAHTQAPRPGQKVLTAQAQGAINGPALQSLLGITQGTWIAGSTDWRIQARLPRLEWQYERPAEHPGNPPTIDNAQRWQPATVRLEASLAGLELDFPAPLAKPAVEPRATVVDLRADPGISADAREPPRAVAPHEDPRLGTLSARVSMGSDSGVFDWRRRLAPAPGESPYEFRRGALRFAGSAQAHDAPGLWLDGRVAELDLSAWLKVDTGHGSGASMAGLIRGADLNVDRFSVLGFTLPGLTLSLRPETDAWKVSASGVAASGTVRVPYDIPGTAPVTIDLAQLTLNERWSGSTASGASLSPASLPPINVEIASLDVAGHHVGAVSAKVVKHADGLELEHAALKGSSFAVTATGQWTGSGDSERCAIDVTADSTDVAETLAAFGFGPSVIAKSLHATGDLHWSGGLDGSIMDRAQGKVSVRLESGQLPGVQPGSAGRVLGLLSVAALPRHLALDFSDLTDKGLAFDSISGDFDVKDGSAYTNNLHVKGPGAQIGVVGRTGFKARDYDQTAVVTGQIGGAVAAAAALAINPAVGVAALLFSQAFKSPLTGQVRGYYRITGPWEHPKIERIGAGEAKEQTIGGSPRPESPAR
jgi:uncharacterized protein (TIGR02099 family)